MRKRLFLAARSILLGWVMLLLIAYVLERPLLNLIGTIFGASWFPTFHLMLDCLVLAVTGWAIGRFAPANPILGVLAFAATLTFPNFGEIVEINIPWLLKLAGDALGDARYWESLGYTAVIQMFLFGSLVGGAMLSRRSRATALSIVDAPK
jgi:hypothetical protein